MATQFTPNLPGSNNGAASTEGRRVDQYDRGYDRGDGCAEGRDYEAAALAVKGKLTSQGYHGDGFVVEDGAEDDFSGDEYEESEEEEEDEPEFSDGEEEEWEPESSDEEDEEEEWEPESSDEEDEEEDGEEEDVEQRAERMASEVENTLLEGLPGGDAEGEAAQVVAATLPPPGAPLAYWTVANEVQMDEAWDKFLDLVWGEYFASGPGTFNLDRLDPLLDEGLPGLLKHFASPFEAMLGLIMSHIQVDYYDDVDRGDDPDWPCFLKRLNERDAGSGGGSWALARLVYQQIARARSGVDMLSLMTGRASTEVLTKQVAAAYHDLTVTPEDKAILLREELFVWCEELIDAEHRRDTPHILACLSSMKEDFAVTEQLLRETGAGKLVNRIRKYEDDGGLVRSAAKALVKEWRAAVAAE
jgi:hypothetical protein